MILKEEMKNIVLIMSLLLAGISCKAQVIGTLEQFEECSKRPNRDELGCPDLENITYVKDTNNRLDQFVGTWKGDFNGKSYEFRFIKKVNFGKYSVKWDKIVGRFSIKDTNGNILYSSLNEPNDENTYFWGKNFQNRRYVMNFTGNTDCMDYGDVFIEIHKNNANQMSLTFSRASEWYEQEKCPNFSTYRTILPNKEKIILTKQ